VRSWAAKVKGNYKFSGAVASNDGKVVFAPYAADGVGVRKGTDGVTADRVCISHVL
jgi:hypothetical protein